MAQKRADRLSGRHVFFREFVQAVQESLPPGSKLSKAAAQQLMTQHSDVYQALPVHEKEVLDRKASQLAVLRSHEAAEDRRHLEGRLSLQRARLEEENLQLGSSNRCNGHRLSEADLQELGALVASPRCERKEVQALLNGFWKPPSAPDKTAIALFEQMDLGEAPARARVARPWLRAICHFRDLCLGIVIGTTLQEGSAVYLFLYATKSPLEAWFLKAIVHGPVLP
eukprot:1285821-Lingulodinium_polyedra.AAC.1